jgi:Pyridoxamine 5'-phosphate oxidase
VTLLQFSLDESDRMYLPTPRTTRKVKNILDRPEVTALVDLGGGWVSCTGPARIIEGAEAADLDRRVYEHILTDAGMVTIGRYLEAAEDTTIEITPTKWLSWDMTRIFEWLNEQEIDPGNPATWIKELTPR